MISVAGIGEKYVLNLGIFSCLQHHLRVFIDLLQFQATPVLIFLPSSSLHGQQIPQLKVSNLLLKPPLDLLRTHRIFLGTRRVFRLIGIYNALKLMIERRPFFLHLMFLILNDQRRNLPHVGIDRHHLEQLISVLGFYDAGVAERTRVLVDVAGWVREDVIAADSA